MHKEIQIAPGVYVTDFRKDKNLVGLEQQLIQFIAFSQRKQLTNDLGLLLDQVVTLESKIQQLLYSINEIKAEQNWQQDGDFAQAVEENWQCIVKFSYEMKQKVLRLYELKYQPQSQKMEKLLQISRIQERQAIALQQVKKNIIKRQEQKKKLTGQSQEKKLAKVSSDSQQEQGQKKKKQKQEDHGVYV